MTGAHNDRHDNKGYHVPSDPRRSPGSEFKVFVDWDFHPDRYPVLGFHILNKPSAMRVSTIGDVALLWLRWTEMKHQLPRMPEGQSLFGSAIRVFRRAVAGQIPQEELKTFLARDEGKEKGEA